VKIFYAWNICLFPWVIDKCAVRDDNTLIEIIVGVEKNIFFCSLQNAGSEADLRSQFAADLKTFREGSVLEGRKRTV